MLLCCSTCPLHTAQLCTYLNPRSPSLSLPTHWSWTLTETLVSLAFQEMNKLLCFWALLPIPESQRLIAAHRPLWGACSPNTAHSLTHIHACTQASPHLPNHPLTHTNTPFCPLPFPNPIMLTSLKKFCSNSFGSKAISCVLQPPHLQIPTHRNTEGCLCAAGCYFYPHCGGQGRGEGRKQKVEAFRCMTDCKHGLTQSGALNVLMWAQMHTTAQTHTHSSQQSAPWLHEMLISFWPKCLQRIELLMHRYISATRPFHYALSCLWNTKRAIIMTG